VVIVALPKVPEYPTQTRLVRQGFFTHPIATTPAISSRQPHLVAAALYKASGSTIECSAYGSMRPWRNFGLSRLIPEIDMKQEYLSLPASSKPLARVQRRCADCLRRPCATGPRLPIRPLTCRHDQSQGDVSSAGYPSELAGYSEFAAREHIDAEDLEQVDLPASAAVIGGVAGAVGRQIGGGTGVMWLP
jgi:hypothetical protein